MIEINCSNCLSSECECGSCRAFNKWQPGPGVDVANALVSAKEEIATLEAALANSENENLRLADNVAAERSCVRYLSLVIAEQKKILDGLKRSENNSLED